MKDRIVLLGPPASGKGTQAELITATFGLPVISPGAMLREEKRKQTDLGIEADKLTAAGRLLPDGLIVDLVTRWIVTHESRFVFDGFPRTVGQAEALDALLDSRRTPLSLVIALEADVSTLQTRVLSRMVCPVCHATLSIGLHVGSADDPCPRCGARLVRRSDDTLEVLAERMQEYTSKTAPLFEYYAGCDLLRRVDSNQKPDVVFHEIRALMEN